MKYIIIAIFFITLQISHQNKFQESDPEEGCSSCLPRIPFFSRERPTVPAPQIVLSDNPVDHIYGWIRFGTVKNLVIYPIDRGTGFHVKSLICTSTGPEFDSRDPFIRNIKDRRLVVYKDQLEEMEVCLDPEINTINCTLNQLSYGDIADFENSRTNILDIEKRYAGENISIQRRRGLQENRELQQLYINKNEYYRIGYFPPQRRSILNGQVRYTNENTNISGLYPNYSHYTLINSKSLRILKSSYKTDMRERGIDEDGNEISYLNFFPHIVFEGDSNLPHQEEFAKRVRIGNVIFGEILPCVHDDHVNFNRTNPQKRFQHLYEYLSRNLPVSESYSAELNQYNSDMPAFGINMEKIEFSELPEGDDMNRISVNDTVYVRY